MPLLDPTSLIPGTVFARRYLIKRILGEGSMGKVLAASDIATGERVAIKCLLPVHAAEPAIVARFLREARATERLRSEHVARVLDHGEIAAPGGAAPLRYLVMERLRGRDLRTICERSGSISVRRAAEYAGQVCVGLAEAHALGIVHRDLKPANIFCGQTHDGRTLIKILDFGVARFQTPSAAGDVEDVTACSVLIGSIRYMAPEQMLDPRAVDARADVWSLGVILYQLVSGVRPFAGSEIVDIAHEVLTSRARPLRDVAPQVPAEFAQIVERCLERQREDRWSSMVALSRALTPFAQRSASGVAAELGLRTITLTAGERDADSLPPFVKEDADGPPTRRCARYAEVQP